LVACSLVACGSVAELGDESTELDGSGPGAVAGDELELDASADAGGVDAGMCGPYVPACFDVGGAPETGTPCTGGTCNAGHCCP
jgi:hypothetical protein